MNKFKAIICTILYAVVLIVALIVAHSINGVCGINLYQLIMNAIANAWLGYSVVKFYTWISEENTND